MTEVWLRPNRRVLLVSLIPASVIAGVGVALMNVGEAAAWRWMGWVWVALGIWLVLGLLSQIRLPRIAYRDGEVLFNLRGGRPVAVPADVIEAFFLGQGPSQLPAVGGKTPETVNLVARLSQKAPQWAEVPVKPALGEWRDGYVTIRGAWCEPLDGEVIRRLNRRLREVRDASAAQAAPQSAASAPEASPT